MIRSGGGFVNVIEINNLTRDYGGGRGIFDMSLAIEKGEAFGFLGPNGAGKTTTIRHIMGFIKCQQGSCSILGKNCFDSADIIQKSLGYIAGEIAFMDDMTGESFIRFIAEYREVKNLGRAKEIMERFELDPKGRIKRMSKGMKQKLGILCAFIHDPDILILDEPTSGLDPLMQSRFIDLVLEEKQRGKTIFMSSHMFEEVERTCDRVAIIKSGRLVAQDRVESIKQSKKKTYVVALKDKEDVERLSKENLQISEIHGNRVTISIRGEVDELIKLLAGYKVEDLEVKSHSLEEAFMHYYGGEKHE